MTGTIDPIKSWNVLDSEVYLKTSNNKVIQYFDQYRNKYNYVWVVHSFNNYTSQIWKLTSYHNGAYTFYNKGVGKYLDEGFDGDACCYYDNLEYHYFILEPSGE